MVMEPNQPIQQPPQPAAGQPPQLAPEEAAVNPAPEQAAVQPVAVPEPDKRRGADMDAAPLTTAEIADAAKDIVQTVKHGVLMPVYRLGRRYIRGVQEAADTLVEGMVNEKKDTK